jgi:transcriptional regulator of acetoin/glycerol metabolism
MDVAEQVRAMLKRKSAFEQIKHLKDCLQVENVCFVGKWIQRSCCGDGRRVRCMEGNPFAHVESRRHGFNKLLTRETSTGKELIARAIPRRSQSCLCAFVSLNRASNSRLLIASELFGHEKEHLRVQCGAGCVVSNLFSG